jgi:hypothetical protein
VGPSAAGAAAGPARLTRRPSITTVALRRRALALYALIRPCRSPNGVSAERDLGALDPPVGLTVRSGLAQVPLDRLTERHPRWRRARWLLLDAEDDLRELGPASSFDPRAVAFDWHAVWCRTAPGRWMQVCVGRTGPDREPCPALRPAGPSTVAD